MVFFLVFLVVFFFVVGGGGPGLLASRRRFFACNETRRVVLAAVDNRILRIGCGDDSEAVLFVENALTDNFMEHILLRQVFFLA